MLRSVTDDNAGETERLGLKAQECSGDLTGSGAGGQGRYLLLEESTAAFSGRVGRSVGRSVGWLQSKRAVLAAPQPQRPAPCRWAPPEGNCTSCFAGKPELDKALAEAEAGGPAEPFLTW